MTEYLAFQVCGLMVLILGGMFGVPVWIDWFRRQYYRFAERWYMRELSRCIIMESKRSDGNKIDVRQFLSSQSQFETLNLVGEFIHNPIKNSPEQLVQWVADRVQYKPEAVDYWQTATETLLADTCDCEDGAILLANLMLIAGLPYYKILVTVFSSPAHVVVIFDHKLFDWTNPSLRTVPSSWHFWYCFNNQNTYATKEHVKEWKK